MRISRCDDVNHSIMKPDLYYKFYSFIASRHNEWAPSQARRTMGKVLQYIFLLTTEGHGSNKGSESTYSGGRLLLRHLSAMRSILYGTRLGNASDI